MDSTLVAAIIIAALGGGGVMALITTLVTAWISRNNRQADARKTTVEANHIQAETRQNATRHYRDLTNQLVSKVEWLEESQAMANERQEIRQTEHERRVGGLHDQLDRLAQELGRANDQLAQANKTITELREEVKSGNAIIADLQERVSALLVRLAKQGGDENVQ